MPGRADTAQGPLAAAGSLTLPLTDEEIRAVYHRHTVRRYPSDDPHWLALVEVQRKKHAKRRLKQATLGAITSRFKRSQTRVSDHYEESWEGTSAMDQIGSTGVGLCAWRDEGAEARAAATPAVHHLLLSRALRALEPETVLEVGSGNGMNLFLLAAIHPAIRFHGAELTAAGVREAEKVKALPHLPPELEAFAADPVVDREAHRRVEFHQASAADLPFEDAAFDVVYTSLALEQMEEIRDTALASVARVARRHVVMVEPFRDFNLEGMRHDYVRSRDILSARVSDLPRFGLKPVCTLSDIPCKLALGVALVIAEKVPTPSAP